MENGIKITRNGGPAFFLASLLRGETDSAFGSAPALSDIRGLALSPIPSMFAPVASKVFIESSSAAFIRALLFNWGVGRNKARTLPSPIRWTREYFFVSVTWGYVPAPHSVVCMGFAL